MTDRGETPRRGAGEVNHIRHGHVVRLARSVFAPLDRADRLDEAVRRMAEKRLSALPVLEDGVPVGIVTESEIMAACVKGCDPGLAVGTAMSVRV